MHKNFLLILVLFAGVLNTYGQWALISTEDNKFNYHSVHFIDGNTGYVAGGYADTTNSIFEGVILKTINGGNTWDTTFVSTTTILHSIYFPTEDTGYVTGTGPQVYKTIDTGNSWVMQSTPASQFTSALKSIFFVDGNTGYACSGDGEAGLIKTSDGGQNWLHDSNAFGGREVFFPSRKVGYTVGGAGGNKTQDSSNTWSTYNTQTFNMTFLDISFLNDTVGYVAGIEFGENFGAVAKTTNGGAIWTSTSIPILSQINAIHFENNNTGYAVGQSNTTYSVSILKTENGGESWGWQEVGNSINYPYLLDVFCIEDTCYAVGWEGKVLKTTNGGGAIYLGINNIKSKVNATSIYPNPTTGTFTVKSAGQGVFTLTDIAGRQIATGRLNEPFTLQGQPAGMYFVKAAGQIKKVMLIEK